MCKVSTKLHSTISEIQGHKKNTHTNNKLNNWIISCTRCTSQSNTMLIVLTWLVGWVTGGGCFDSRAEGSVSPLVCTISVGPFEDDFSMMGMRSSRAGLWRAGRTMKTPKRVLWLGWPPPRGVSDPYLMWSYFLNIALYSTALCCSSTSMLLP